MLIMQVLQSTVMFFTILQITSLLSPLIRVNYICQILLIILDTQIIYKMLPTHLSSCKIPYANNKILYSQHSGCQMRYLSRVSDWCNINTVHNMAHNIGLQRMLQKNIYYHLYRNGGTDSRSEFDSRLMPILRIG